VISTGCASVFRSGFRSVQGSDRWSVYSLEKDWAKQSAYLTDSWSGYRTAILMAYGWDVWMALLMAYHSGLVMEPETDLALADWLVLLAFAWALVSDEA